jgi:hypothetical protein
MSKNFNSAPYDRENSTYKQYIFFTNGKMIEGYSKKVGFAEPVDATNCLTNFILRMYIKGYLRPGTRYDPIDNITYLYNKTNQHIVTCYYDFPEFNPEILSDEKKVSWITNFYKDINDGKKLSYIEKKYHRRGRKTSEPTLDVTTHAFVSPDHLIRKIKVLFQEGRFSMEQITHFYRQAFQIYFPKDFASDKKKDYDSYVLKLATKFNQKTD